ncbi:unnamed protein product [Ilex paraguariensis]|uniref:Uncharacterized protein n=1 Tax=Ilex paraguariensis TaxID=185542 RepID=A0ABC8RWJ4_9AQUA
MNPMLLEAKCPSWDDGLQSKGYHSIYGIEKSLRRLMIVVGGFIDVDRQTENLENLLETRIRVHKPSSGLLKTSFNVDFHGNSFPLKVKVFSSLGRFSRENKFAARRYYGTSVQWARG